MIKRFGISSIAVLLLSVLVSLVATADFSGNGTTGGIDDSGRENGLGRSVSRPLPESVNRVIEPGKPEKITLSDGSLELGIPSGLSDKALEFSVEPQRAPGGGGTRVFQKWDLRAFEVEAALDRGPISPGGTTDPSLEFPVDAVRGDEVKSFSKEITLTSVFHADDVRGMDWSSLRFVWFDPEKETWIPIPTEVDIDSRTMTAKTDHFSIYGSQGDSAYSLPGDVLNFQTDLHSGAATYSLPIGAPHGEAGFRPLNLTLNYNSGSVDGMRNVRDVGSAVGIGWSFSLPYIFYNEEEEKHYLSWNGVVAEMFEYNTSGTDLWRTVPDLGVVIEEAGTNKWRVHTNDGDTYTFGDDGATSDNIRHHYANGCFNKETYRWDLSVITNRQITDPTIHTQFQIHWDQDEYLHNPSIPACLTDRFSYITQIDVTQDSWPDMWRIFFTYAGDQKTGQYGTVRDDVPNQIGANNEPLITATRALTKIRFDYGTVIEKEYILNYTTTDASLSVHEAGEHVLDSVDIYGDGGLSGNNLITSIDFDYTDKEVYFQDSVDSSNSFDFNRPYLTKVTNGFEGEVTFDYTQVPASPAYDTWTRQVVTKTTANPDPGNDTDGVPIITEFEYLDGDGNPGLPVYDRDSSDPWLDEFRGFPLVKRITSDGGYTLHHFYTQGNSTSIDHPIDGSVTRDGERLKGRKYMVETFDQYGDKLTASFSDWKVRTNSIYSSVYRAVLDNSGTIVSPDSNPIKTWSWFTVDDQGNRIKELHEGNTAVTGDEYTIYRDFEPNTDYQVWILNLPYHERVYRGDVADNTASTQIGETKFYYDDDPLGTEPDRGLLTKRETFTGDGAVLVELYEYDNWGNVKKYTDPRGESIDYVYDTGNSTFLWSTTRHPTTGDQITYQWWDEGPGLLTKIRDANGNDTEFIYDEERRLIKVIEPGDDSTNPTRKFDYLSWGTNGQQRVVTEQKISDTEYIKQTEFFDGLGRRVQAHQSASTSGKTLILETTVYDGMGRPTVYTPWEVTGTPTSYQSPFSTTSGSKEESAGTAANVDDGGPAWTGLTNLSSSDGNWSSYTGTGTVLADTGWLDPTGTAEFDYNTGVVWDETAGVATLDLGYAYADVPRVGDPVDNEWTDYLWAKYDQIDLPHGSDINGFEAKVRYQEEGTTCVTGHTSLVKSSAATGTTKNLSSNFSNSWTTTQLGSSTDLWGATWTDSDVEAAGFGVGVVSTSCDTGSSSTVNFDHIELKVHYDEPVLSDYLDITNFDLNVPVGARIDGIEVKIERSAETNTFDVRDEVIQLLHPSGPVGDNKAKTTNWPISDAVETYGTSTDTWGREWTVAEVNSDAFGVRIQVRTESLDDVRIDEVKIKVHYKETVSDVYASGSVTDALGRVIEQRGVDGAAVGRAYAPATASGEVWQTTVTDPLGNTVKNYTDAFGRLVRIEEFDDATPTQQKYRETRYSYDELGNLIKVEVDPEEAGLDTVITEMTYDWLGRKLTHRDADVGFWRYTYDKNGNLKTQTDARGVEITFTYDDMSRETRRQCTNNCPGGTTPVTLAEFSYDSTTGGNEGKERRTSAYNGDDSGSYTVKDEYFYDTRGRVTKHTRTIQGDVYVTEYTYDPANRVVTSTLPSGEVVTQDYDSRSLPESLTSSVIGDIVTSSTYNVLDLPIQVALGNGAENNREYFTLDHQTTSTANFGQLYRIESTDGTTPFVDLTFDWDLNGNLTSRTDEIAIGGPSEEEFTYDFLNRLTAADTPLLPPSVPQPDAHFAFETLAGDVVVDSAGTQDGTGETDGTVKPALDTSGYHRNGVEFDGTDAYVDLPHEILDGKTDVSVSFWFKTTTSAYQTWISGARGSGSGADNEFLVWMTGSTGIQFRAGSNFVSWNDLPSFTDGNWHHVGVVRDDTGNEAALYLDGVFYGSQSLTMGTLDVQPDGLVLGTDQDAVGGSFGQWFDGSMDELRFYDRLLTSSEMADLADSRAPRAHYEFDETSGTNASDTAASYDGTLTNGAVFTTSGKFDGGVTLDGDNDFIDLPSTAMDGLADASVSLWIKTTETSLQSLLSAAHSGNANEFLMWFNTSTKFEVYNEGSTYVWDNLDAINDGNWHHVVLVRDARNGELILYIDGVSEGTKTATLNRIDVDTNGLVIGQDQDSVGGGFDVNQAFNGTMDDLRIYTVPLSASEVVAIYNNADQTYYSGTDNRTYSYDGHDNITSKPGQATYTYDVDAGPTPALSVPLIDESSSTDHYWSFNSDDITGDTVDDLLGTAGGTLEPDAGTGPQAVAGLFDDALDFDGTTQDYVSLPNTIVDGKTDLTFSLWIKTSKTGEQALISGANSTDSNDTLIFFLNHTELRFYADDEIATWKSLPSVADNEWHHIVVVRDDTNNFVHLYLDGVHYGAISVTIGPADVDANGFLLGQEQDSVGGGFVASQALDGLMDDLRIYDRALDAGEAIALYYSKDAPSRPHLVSGTYGLGSESGLVHRYALNGNSVDQTRGIITDLGSEGANLEVNGTPTYQHSGIGALGETYLYDADTEYLKNSGGLAADLDEEFTVSFWVYGDVDGTGSDSPLAIGGSSEYVSFYVDYSGSPKYMRFKLKTDTTWRQAIIGSAFENDTWIHYALGYSYDSGQDETSLSFYKDGDLEGTATYPGQIGLSASDIIIGQGLSGSWSTWPGMVDEVRVYDRKLSDTEVTELGSEFLPTGASYSYDANGNTITRGDQELVWNAENLLEEVEDASTSNTIESYIYDADGQRAVKTDAAGDKTHYVSGLYQVGITSNGHATTTNYFHGGQIVATAQSTPITVNTTPEHIVPNGAGSGDELHSVAIDGDTLVVTSPFEDSAASGAGIAYVYRLNKRLGEWELEDTLTIPNAATGDNAGELTRSVAIDGDTIAVGARRDDASGTDSGAVYVFVRSGTTWSQQGGALLAKDAGANELFGAAIALDGDMLVATSTVDNGNKGSVNTFTRSGTTWTRDTNDLTETRIGANQTYGVSVALLEGDTLVVGASGDDDNGQTDSGSVFVYERENNAWVYKSNPHQSDPEAYSYFGVRVAISGKYLLVGARGDDEEAADSGAAYLYSKNDSGFFTYRQKITGSDIHASSNFGVSVDIDGDMLIVGADGQDGTVSDSGGAYLFRLEGDTWVEHAAITGDSGASGDLFGYSVSIEGEWAVIGAKLRHDGATTDTGAFSVIEVRDESLQFLHPDHLGSPVAASDVFGDVVGTQSFFPFGEVRSGSGIFDTERSFTGQIFDGGTGLGFYNARYYDTALGKFISPDRIVPNAYMAIDFNKFTYVRNNPLVYVDPTGLTCSFWGENDSCDEGDPSQIAPDTIEEGWVPYAPTYDIFKNEDIAKTSREINAKNQAIQQWLDWYWDLILESDGALSSWMASEMQRILDECQACGRQIGGKSYDSMMLEVYGVDIRAKLEAHRAAIAEALEAARQKKHQEESAWKLQRLIGALEIAGGTVIITTWTAVITAECLFLTVAACAPTAVASAGIPLMGLHLIADGACRVSEGNSCPVVPAVPGYF